MISNCLTIDIERTDKMNECEVYYQNKSAGVTISGTLTLPAEEGVSPAVILIAGYGQNDRDYTLMKHKLFVVLAEHLTKLGLAVLRFDKRGVGKSTGDYASATSRDFADDVLAGIECLKTRKDIDASRIGLIGHSEGGMIASMLAAESKDVAFIVLMAGVVQTAVNDLVAQTAKQMKADGASDELLTQDRELRTHIFEIIKQEADAKVVKATLLTLMQDYWNHLPEPLKLESEKIPFAITESNINGMIDVFNSAWYRYFISCKPTGFLKQIKVPVLAIYGDCDWVTSSQPSIAVITKALKVAKNSNLTAIEFSNMNHWLQTCKSGALAEYSTIEEAISSVALKTISDWILSKNLTD
jgi:pimeloyl-ACP methyl ester carboxylesterase